jgi:hypothetical protein
MLYGPNLRQTEFSARLALRLFQHFQRGGMRSALVTAPR